MNTRDRIIQTADALFYQRGFEPTSFADIAEEVGISRGNFYHHFRTKDQILDAVISLRSARTRALLDGWEAEGETPQARIVSFIRILIANQSKIMASGCPVGTLCNELARLDHAAWDQSVELFSLFRAWLTDQFTALGRAADADALAVHLLGRSQGVAALANAYRDEALVRLEVETLEAWLADQIPDSNPIL